MIRDKQQYCCKCLREVTSLNDGAEREDSAQVEEIVESPNESGIEKAKNVINVKSKRKRFLFKKAIELSQTCDL